MTVTSPYSNAAMSGYRAWRFIPEAFQRLIGPMVTVFLVPAVRRPRWTREGCQRTSQKRVANSRDRNHGGYLE